MSAKGTDAMDALSSPKVDERPRARQWSSQRVQALPRKSSHSPESVPRTKRPRLAPVPKASERVPKSRSTASRATMTPIQQTLNESNVGIAQDHSSASDRAFSDSSTRHSRARSITIRSNETLQMSTGYHEAAMHMAGQPWSAPSQYDTSAARVFDSDPIPKNPLNKGRARSLLQIKGPFSGEAQANAEDEHVPSAPDTEIFSGAGSSKATSLSQASPTASEHDMMEVQPASHRSEGAPVQSHVANSATLLGQLDRGKFPLARRPTQQHLREISRSHTNTPPSPSPACSPTATAMESGTIARVLKKSQAADKHTRDLFGQGRHSGQAPLHNSSDKDSTENMQVASGSMHTRRLPQASPTKKQWARHREAEKTDASPRPSAVGPLKRGSADAAAGGQRRSAIDSQALMAMPRFGGRSSELDDDGPLIQQASLRRALSF